MDQRKFKNLTFISLIFFLTLPIMTYIYHFGFHISSNHERWGQMGSLFSGIYAPLLTLGTLAILYLQYQVQLRMEQSQRDTLYWAEQKSYFRDTIEIIRKLASTQENANAIRRARELGLDSLSDEERLHTKILAERWSEANNIMQEAASHSVVGNYRLKSLKYEASIVIGHAEVFLLDSLAEQHRHNFETYHFAPQLNFKSKNGQEKKG